MDSQSNADKPRSLLPANASQFERALENCVSRVTRTPIAIDTLWDPERCPVEFLPWLAWTLSVDDWNADWSEEVKRRVIGEAVSMHRMKGTVGAVKAALRPFGATVSMVEWWQHEPPEDPYTFSVNVVASRTVTQEFLREIRAAVDAAKPVRSKYTLEVGQEISATLSFAASCRVAILFKAELGAKN